MNIRLEGEVVLVTGGAGFIGANLLRLCESLGAELRVLDDLSTGYRENLPSGVELIVGDVRDARTMSDALDRVDIVVHLAAQSGVPDSVQDPWRDHSINVEGTLTLLEACRARAANSGNGPRIVFASSNAPLGRQRPPADETKAPLPVAPYGASKLAAEGYCLAYHGTWGLGTCVLRFGNVYGPFSSHKTSVVAQFLRAAMTDGVLTVYGDGSQTRDFIYVGDLCEAILVAALHPAAVGEVFHISSGVETEIGALADLTGEVVQQELQIRYDAPRIGDVERSFASVSKAESVLGWKPRTSLPTGLASTAEWFASESVNV